MTAPQRIQLSRGKGWRMPPNTVKVDRTTRWGNPFIVGTDGPAPQCVYWLILLHAGFWNVSISAACADRQRVYQGKIKTEAEAGYPTLRGRNLACWCRPGAICHAEVLLEMANRPAGAGREFNLDAFLARFGYRLENGKVLSIAAATVQPLRAPRAAALRTSQSARAGKPGAQVQEQESAGLRPAGERKGRRGA